MSDSATVKNLFEPLDTRLLSYFESDKYINNAYLFIDHVGEENYFNGDKLASNLVASVHISNPKELVEEATFYLTRVKKALKKLKPTKSEIIGYATTYPSNEPDSTDVRKTTHERNEELLKIHKEELFAYKQVLESIISSRKQSHKLRLVPEVSIENLQHKAVKVYTVPENRKVTAFHRNGFESDLDADQVALFFYYFKEHNIFPEYDAQGQGHLAEYLFAKNEQRVRKAIGEMMHHTNTEREVHLKKLQTKLQHIIDHIRKDLNKCTKKSS